MTGSDARRFDLVVFGASSFVGRIICSYLVDRLGTDGRLRWAIAGRSDARPAEVAEQTGADVERIVADANDADSMRRLAESCRVVATTVGPYALYGSELVAAAATVGTDYCDLSGEPLWIQRMIDLHDESARASGARIVHSCGFDSIPSDLGVWFTQQWARERFGQHCTRIAMRVRGLAGGVSGGTIASMMQAMEELADAPTMREMLANPYSLAPSGMRHGVDQASVTYPRVDETSGEWIAPFVMASINAPVVHRTHALQGRPWGDDFRYDEAMMMGEGPLGAAKASALAGGLGLFIGAASMGLVRSLLNRVLPNREAAPHRRSRNQALSTCATSARPHLAKRFERGSPGIVIPGMAPPPGCSRKRRSPSPIPTSTHRAGGSPHARIGLRRRPDRSPGRACRPELLDRRVSLPSCSRRPRRSWERLGAVVRRMTAISCLPLSVTPPADHGVPQYGRR